MVKLGLSDTCQHLVSQVATWRQQEQRRIFWPLPSARRHGKHRAGQLLEAARKGYGTTFRSWCPCDQSFQLTFGTPERPWARRAQVAWVKVHRPGPRHCTARNTSMSGKGGSRRPELCGRHC